MYPEEVRRRRRQQSINRIPSPTKQARTNGNTQVLNQSRPGVPDMQIEGLTTSGSQQSLAQQSTPAQQQQSPAQQSAQQQQQGQQQQQIPSAATGGMGQVISREGGTPGNYGQEVVPGTYGARQTWGNTGALRRPGLGGVQTARPDEFDPFAKGLTTQTPAGGLAGGETQTTPGAGLGQEGSTRQLLPEFKLPALGSLIGAQDERDPKVAGTPTKPSTGGGDAAGGGGDEDNEDAYAAEDAEFAEQLAGMDEDLAGLRDQTLAGSAAQQRRQAEINAALGRSVGGGFGGAMAATSAQTVQDLAALESQVNAQKRSVQLAWLDKKLARKERAMDKDFQREMTDDERAHQLKLLALEFGLESGLTAAEIQTLMESGTSGTSGEGGGDTNQQTGQANTQEAADEYAEEHTRSADDGGSVEDWAYEDGVYGRSGYTYPPTVEDGYVSFSGSSYSVSVDSVYGRLEDIFDDMGLDSEGFLNKLKRGKRPVDPETGDPIPNYIGDNFATSDKNMEFFAWYTSFLKENSGKKPTDEDIQEKLAAIGVL